MAATAVIVNEFGEIGLDHLLVERSSEDVVLLNSGCLCCTVRGDIVDTLTNLFVDRVKGKVPFFTRVVIETTGLADPAPILHTLMTDPIVAARYMLDGVVTTVDAVNGAGTLDRQPEAVKQAAVADRLLLTKTDLAEPGAAAGDRGAAQGAQSRAPRSCRSRKAPSIRRRCSISASTTRRPRASMCGAGCATRPLRRGHEHEHDHEHIPTSTGTTTASAPSASPASGRSPGPRCPAWLDGLATMRGDDLLRLKAIVALSDRPDQPVVLHGVQHLFHPPVLLPEWPSEDRRTRMVFITRDLPQEAIEATLAAFEKAVEETPAPCPPRRADGERDPTRFSRCRGSAAATTAFAGSARAVMGPDDKFDLVIKGGEVLDPSQSLRGKRDIGIRYGVIEAVEPEIPAARALRVLDASGQARDAGPRRSPRSCLSLWLGDRDSGRRARHPSVHDDLRIGWRCRGQQFRSVPPLHSGADAHPPLRLHTYRQYRARVIPGRGAHQHRHRRCGSAAKAIAENADIVIGAKVRMSENVIAKNGVEPLKRAIAACEKAGTGGRVMVHIGGVETRALMSQILDLLRPGDILTHAYSGAPNLAGDFTNIVQDGRLLPAALAAKQRGVIFDVGHGGGSFDYTVAEIAIAQGCPPDTISSDIHVFSGNTPGMPYVTWVMSKFLGLGFPLDQVVAMATINPAKIINRLPKLGTLQVGAPGDVAIMELVEAP